MDTLYTFWDKINHENTESVNFFGRMNSATKKRTTLVDDMMPLRHICVCPVSWRAQCWCASVHITGFLLKD